MIDFFSSLIFSKPQSNIPTTQSQFPLIKEMVRLVTDRLKLTCKHDFHLGLTITKLDTLDTVVSSPIYLLMASYRYTYFLLFVISSIYGYTYFFSLYVSSSNAFLLAFLLICVNELGLFAANITFTKLLLYRYYYLKEMAELKIVIARKCQ